LREPIGDYVYESNNNYDSSSSSDSDGSSDEEGSSDGGDDKQRGDIIRYVEQKITEFFRTTPSNASNRQEPKSTTY
jgi:hypothetical protein